MSVRKVRVVVELDENLVRQIDRVRGDVGLPKMLGIVIELGFNAMKLMAKQQRRAPTT